MPRLMTTDALSARDVMNDVRAACEKTGRAVDDAELERALDGLPSADLKAVRLTARQPIDARPLGPQAIVDISRGVAPSLAAAREISGYYELRAERDALATIARRDRPAPAVVAAPPPAPVAAMKPAPSVEPLPAPVPAPRAAKAPVDDASKLDSQRMMTLFAYHRDAVRVAQEMGFDMAELNGRIEALGLRRRINRLLESTTDIDLFSPEGMGVGRTTGSSVPVVRRRSDKAAAEAAEAEIEAIAPEAATAPVDTSPVNAHGTRVYRRPEQTPIPDVIPPGGLAARREYVREGRRRRTEAPRPVAPVRRDPAPPPPKAPSKRPFGELQSSAGAGVMERLLADEKANPRVLAAKLGERYDGPGRALNESDLRALLQHHGLAETFREREQINTRFLIGFHQGAKAKLANALQMSAEEVSNYLTRLGLSEDLDRTRGDRAKLELGRRKINDRIVQVLTRAPYLDDLGVLPVIDREVRDYLNDQFAARGASAGEAIRAELGMEKNPFAKLLRRYGLAEKPEAAE
jgi:hypothetical protein